MGVWSVRSLADTSLGCGMIKNIDVHIIATEKA